MLFIPLYWWHAVWGIDQNMSINYWWRARPANLLQHPRQTADWTEKMFLERFKAVALRARDLVRGTVPTPPESTKTLVAATAASQGHRTLATAGRPDHSSPRWVRLGQWATARRHHTAAVPPTLRRLSQQLGLRDPSRQPQRLRRHHPAQRIPRRHPRRSPRLRLRPLPQRPNRLGPTVDELTGVTTSEASLGPPRWAAGLGGMVAVGCWLRSGPSLPSDDRGAAARLSAGQDRLGRPGWRSWLRW